MVMNETSIYPHLAGVLSYPGPDYAQRVLECLDAAPPVCVEEIRLFAEAVLPLPQPAAQELFTQTFDLNPLCSLELGWHLFGEQYERGLLLVRMRQELRAANLPENSELPDHLAHALRLLVRMDRARAADFSAAVLLPALMKMLVALRGKQNPYEHVLKALAFALREDFPEIPLYSNVALPVISREVTA
jgi:nitrate reductase delta subunit